MSIRLATILVCIAFLCGGAPDAAWETLDRAYKALNARDYDTAVEQFSAAVRLDPKRPDVRKDLAYTYLKIGEPELARDQFADAMKLDPADEHVALEYAFLCFETKQLRAGLDVFRKLKERGNPTATERFRALDAELAEGIARWTKAVELTPASYSAHEELARLSEIRGEARTAAEHYMAAWKLRPAERKYLMDLGRVWQQDGKPEQATAALLAASRGAEPRVGELARALLPARYPWVYEFRAALDLDPTNLPLHRELAFLLIEMGQKKEAEAEFRIVVEKNPDDALATAQLGFLLINRNAVEEAMPLLERVLTSSDEDVKDRVRSTLRLPRQLRTRPDIVRSDAAIEALRMADKSFDAGYLKDAVRYLQIAHENDPLNFKVLVKLGWAYNLLHQDKEAVGWFNLARRSPEEPIARQAEEAWSNLHPQFARVRNSVWAYPMYSSRWRDLFSWAQYKSEFFPAAPLSPYISVRLAGDVRQTATSGYGLSPAWLSESAVVLAAGVTTKPFHGMRVWAEAGYGLNYIKQGDAPAVRPDMRGGLSAARSFGRNLGAKHAGIFAEANADLLYISRFDRDTLAYTQSRAGYTLPSIGPAQLQLTWNFNLTADVRRLGWANSLEYGPGLRLRFTALPGPVILSADVLTGRYTVLDGTRPPSYSDIRIGLWYAFSR